MPGARTLRRRQITAEAKKNRLTKKAITFLVLNVTPSITFAQGAVVFQDYPGPVERWTTVYDSTLVPVPVAGGYVALIAAPNNLKRIGL